MTEPKYTRSSFKASVVNKDGDKVKKTVYVRTKDGVKCVKAGVTAAGKTRYVPVTPVSKSKK